LPTAASHPFYLAGLKQLLREHGLRTISREAQWHRLLLPSTDGSAGMPPGIYFLTAF
jgi:hypothetical protein